MEIDCFVYPGWRPRLRAASARRAWMDATPESYAYRCLPLGIANAHGWELLSPCGFEAEWRGGADASEVTLTLDADAPADGAPISLFGQGTITFHVPALFRTPPGWNLWVGGPPNEARDGIAPLTGVIETDWSPYSFTMNWRFTRPGCRVRFEENEPICFLFPVERKAIEAVVPRFRAIDEAPELKAQFETWSRSRDEFHRAVAADPPAAPADKWQKLYYRGVDANGRAAIADHRAKLRLREFADPPVPVPARRCPVSHAAATPPPPPASDGAALALRRRDWLLETQERMRALSADASAIARRRNVNAIAFLDEHYAAGRPVLLEGAAAGWPAVTRWSSDHLRARIGAAVVEVQADRCDDPLFERRKEAHRTTMPFDRFLDRAEGEAANNLYLTAWNSAANAAALAPLRADIGPLDAVLRPGSAAAEGMPWIGPAGTFTPLHHDLTNNLLVQIHGCKLVVLASPGETAKLPDSDYVLSGFGDVLSPDFDFARFPDVATVRWHRILLEPGDALFVPVGWWHQVRALDFSVSWTCTSFHWPNDAHAGYPLG